MATAGDQYDFRTGNVWNFAQRDDIHQVRRLILGERKDESAHLAGPGEQAEGRSATCPGQRMDQPSAREDDSTTEDQDGSSTTAIFASKIPPDLRNKVGWTPLHAAANGGALRVLSFLLQHPSCRGVLKLKGTDEDNMINHRCKAGRTPLMEAARNGRFQAVKLLLKAKANLNIEDNKGQTALTHAAKDKAVRELLAGKMAGGAGAGGETAANVEHAAAAGSSRRDESESQKTNQSEQKKKSRKKKFGRNVVSSSDEG